MQSAQRLSLVAALLRQRESVTVSDGAGGVPEVSYNGNAVQAAGSACARCYIFAVEE